jgi:hypothetical protein
MADIKALVDSGATNNFIHPTFVKRMGLGQRELDKPKNIYNIDDTTNKVWTDYPLPLPHRYHRQEKHRK